MFYISSVFSIVFDLLPHILICITSKSIATLIEGAECDKTAKASAPKLLFICPNKACKGDGVAEWLRDWTCNLVDPGSISL